MRRKTSNGLKLTASDETLYNLYGVERMTLKEIGRRFGVTAQTVQRRLSRIGVSRTARRRDIDPEILRSLYVDQHLSRQQIASRLGVSSYRVIQGLQLNGIRRRTFLDELALKHPFKEIEQLYVRQGLGQAAAAAQLGVDQRSFRRLLDRYGIRGRHKPGPRLHRDMDNDDLRHLYIDEHCTIADIAVKYGCSGDTIRRRLKKLGLYQRYNSRPTLLIADELSESTDITTW